YWSEDCCSEAVVAVGVPPWRNEGLTAAKDPMVSRNGSVAKGNVTTKGIARVKKWISEQSEALRSESSCRVAKSIISSNL
ncbi:hypothetical protein HAX54_016172, partial [Datura stramonium]|nr:hypothetical protein [Datura stramonium]